MRKLAKGQPPRSTLADPSGFVSDSWIRRRPKVLGGVVQTGRFSWAERVDEEVERVDYFRQGHLLLGEGRGLLRQVYYATNNGYLTSVDQEILGGVAETSVPGRGPNCS